MNSREQALQRRVAYLEAQNAALMMVLDRAIQDIEAAESVACAFAWDVQTRCGTGDARELLANDFALAFRAAVEASK